MSCNYTPPLHYVTTPRTALCNYTPHIAKQYGSKNTRTAFRKRMIGEPQTMSGLPTIIGKKVRMKSEKFFSEPTAIGMPPRPRVCAPAPPCLAPQRARAAAAAEQGRSMAGAKQEQGWPTAEQGWPTAEQGQSTAGTAGTAGARQEHRPRSPFSLVPQAQRQAGTAAMPGNARHCPCIARHGRGVASLPRCFSRAREQPTHEHGPAAAGCRGGLLSRRRLSTFCAEPRRLLHPAPSGGLLNCFPTSAH
jgi:hypothetical protein